jgi:hypothetical protein
MKRLPDNLASDPRLADMPEDERLSLLELLDRVLNTGVVIVGDVTVSVAGVDLIYLSLRALLTSVETARTLDAGSFAAPARVLAERLGGDA